MNYLYKIMLLVAAACCLNACEDLDEFPEDDLSPETYFGTESELELYTNQFYSQMPSAPSNAAEGKLYWYCEQGEHFVSPTLVREIQGTRLIPADADDVGWTWSALRKVNYFLKNNVRCDDESVRERYNGVAYFFRAYFYYNMLVKFGDLPWYDTPVGSGDGDLLYKARDSRDVIIKHIIADCDSAAKSYRLPSARTPYEVNRWTALALKARACLFEGTFRKYHAGDVFNPDNLPSDELLRLAAEAAKEVMTQGGYSLYNEGSEPYRDLFASFEARDCEIIWARRVSEESAIKCNANGWANTRRVGFTKRFVNLYLNSDGTRFTDNAGWETKQFVEECTDRDPRMAQTVYCPGYIQKGETKSYMTDMSGNLSTGYKYIKYVREVKYNTWDASMVALPLFRLGEMYLIYAEALAELGTITQNDLDISINVLRDRVGMPHLNLAWANQNPCPYMQSADWGYPNVTKSANTGVILEIRRERLIELCLESLHYSDILRWKEGKVYEKPFYGQYFPGPGKYDLTGDGKADVCLYVGTKPSGRGLTFLEIGVDVVLSEGESGYIQVHSDPSLQCNWTEDKDYLFAIPINERLLSGMALDQNPGWNDGL